MMYFAPQLGQSKAIGSDFSGVQRAGICPNKQKRGDKLLSVGLGQQIAL
jgi:hypothetical protein